ncbi:MAG TPA: peptide-N-glycosidase F-related protein [Bacteroidia bacterium]|nr:peptide-N-glycosidase F-related protein [Bacteroidia bacterium]HNT80626.1 peptide-N-glycosidase F-related protein [Bacteroidia bacterium]
MKRILLALTFLFIYSSSFSGIGDTIMVQGHNQAHMSWYGNYDAWTLFPPAGNSYHKIIMDVTLGCPPTDCSQWDYTVDIDARHRTGTFDSTLSLVPMYVVNNNGSDTIFYNSTPYYVTFFDTLNMVTDSTLSNSYYIYERGDTLNPTTATDSITAYPANYYNYYFSASGVILDSIWVGYSTSIINYFTNVYTPFEIIVDYELARVITPYGGYFNPGWSHTWRYDITEYAKFLVDSVQLRALYEGWSDGFALTTTFYFIEGTPAREVKNIHSVYNKGIPYGNVNNPVENYLVPKTYNLDSTEVQASFRVTPSGHGADNTNCAEFCIKQYYVLVDGLQRYTQTIWRSDCGMNSLYHQAGTWLYDRANWCPGEKVTTRDHDLTNFITPGVPVTVDLNLTAYTGTGSASYNINSQLITYGANNFNLDATIEEVIAPNKNFHYNRFNPICGKPIVILKNTGNTNLTSATITYGLEGGTMTDYTWYGLLGPYQTSTVTLDNMVWGGTNSEVFKCYVHNINGMTDDYPYNDTIRTEVLFTPELPTGFHMVLRTNTKPWETTWQLKDALTGTILYQNGTMVANTIYRDTFLLNPGCYDLTIYDSGKNGLQFFANNDGTGYARLMPIDGTGTVYNYFQADFGTQISYRFTVGYTTGIEASDVTKDIFWNVFPNPSSGIFQMDMILPSNNDLDIKVLNLMGEQVALLKKKNFKAEVFDLDLSHLSSGIYMVMFESNGKLMQKKISIQK